MGQNTETNPNSGMDTALLRELELKYDTYSDDEKNGFDSWLNNIPENSIEHPIIVKTAAEILTILPRFPNYTYEPINIFFQTDTSVAKLEEILKGHISQSPGFEVSIVKHGENNVSVGIGSKIRNNSTIPEGDFFGHNHPILERDSKINLPNIFLQGLIPSPGDIQGYSRFVDTIKNGTRIYSPYGFVDIMPSESFNTSNMTDYSSKYFKLFNGENEFDWATDEDVSKYFEEKFHLKLEFHLLDHNESAP